MFSPEMIRQRIRQQPFVPIRIVTISGETYEVHHPDLLMVGQREVIVGLPSKKNPVYCDGVARVALLHVTDLQDILVPIAPGGNGATG